MAIYFIILQQKMVLNLTESFLNTNLVINFNKISHRLIRCSIFQLYCKTEPFELPLIDGLECDLIRHALGLLQEQDDPRRSVRPLLRQVDPRRQAVPVKDDLMGAQQATCPRRVKRSPFTLL